MSKILLSPSLLAADFSDMRKALSLIEFHGGDWIHFDIMDGHFVPALTFGPQMASQLRPHTKLPFDVHLMVESPENYIQPFADSGAQWLTYHFEAARHHNRIISSIRKLGMKPGISSVPSTTVSNLSELLPLVDLVLVMGVDPGFGGQTMLESTATRVYELSEFREERNLDFLISVDGGVNLQTYQEIVKAGADVLVAGSAFFGSNDPSSVSDQFHSGQR